MESHNRFQSLDQAPNAMNRTVSGNAGGFAHRGRGRARGRGNASAGPSRGRNQFRDRSRSTGRYQGENTETAEKKVCNNPQNGARAPRQPRDERNPRVIRPTGYNRLVELLDKNAREVTLTLQDEGFGFYELLKLPNIKADSLVVILKLLAEVAQCNTCPQNQFALLNNTMSGKLYSTYIPRYMASAPHDRTERLRLPQTVAYFMVLCRKLLIAFPNKTSDELGIAFVTCKDIVQRNGDLGLGVDPHICADFTELDDIRVKILAKFDASTRDKNAQEESALAQPPPDDFRLMAVTPTHADIHEELNPFLRPNVVGGKYFDVEHYLDVHFRLMREDFITPLREGLINYLTLVERGLAHKVNQRDIKIYHNVRISMPECTPFDGLAYRLNFNVEKLKRVNWEATKRLLFGSLVCLSSNNFQSFMLATVVKRDAKQLKDGFFNVRFILAEGRNAWDLNPNEVFTMIESPAYFEAYSPILKGLQSITEETLPFRKYIVDASTDLAAPKYLNRLTEFLITSLLAPEIRATKDPFCQILNDTTWPTAEDMRLDVAQYRALKSALTKEVAIIQGPPGTGKTFLGLKIMEVLQKNMEEWSKEGSPILVICFTNHALDQFLEGILEFAPKSIVRVGGQSKCKALEPFSMNYLRKTITSERRLAKYVHHSRARLYWQMHQIQDDINKIAGIVKICETRILHEKAIEEFMDPQHFAQLQYLHGGFQQGPRKAVSVIVEWLGLLNVVFDDEETEVDEFNSKAGPSMVLNKNEATPEDLEEEEEEMQRRIVDDYGDDELLNWSANAVRAEDHFEQVVIPHMGGRITPTDARGQTDGFQVQGGARKMKKTISSNMRKTDIMGDEEAGGIRNVIVLPYGERWRLYRYWVSKLRSKKAKDVQTLQREYEACYKQLQEVLKEIDIAILQEARVIGMTTTGAAKNREVLQIIAPKIVIVEEAAEVLESHIITALTKDCQHLILIGDQQQLRPNPTVYKLAKDYKLDVSLFERLIKNGLAYERLTLQHRMRPRIAALLVPHIYPDLQNDKSVEEYEEVRGVDDSVFFINHSHHETTVQDSTSRANDFEAQFLVALCRYLLLQGYESSQITILATYLGQLFLFKKLTKNTIVANVRCTVVDNYQGEENDIILLSLVRSNVDGQVGFLKVDNRICVALSRAKKGLYCIGNFDFLEENADKWKPIVASMRRDGLVGPQLTLRCQNHPHTATLVAVAKDFDHVPEGGCQLPCEYRLPCGHQCPKVCHAYDREHLEIKCTKKCDKILCENDHRCPKKCYERCGECHVLISKKLPCGHENMLHCYRDLNTAMCQHPCAKMLSCGHPCKKTCGDTCNTMDCLAKVQRKASCEHMVTIPCNKAKVAELLLKFCKNPCGEMLPCGHRCSGNCILCHQGRMHIRCKEKCGRALICNHPCNVPCAKNCPPCLRQCENRCIHSKCPNRCGFPCQACMEPCPWECQHYACTKLCHEPCNRPPCDHPCQIVLKCGHPCIGLCGEPCPPKCRECDKEVVCEIFFGSEDEDDARFVFLEDCGHVIEAGAMDAWMQQGTEEAHGSIGMKTCPRCKTIIKCNLRYGTIINKILADVMAIKTKIFGNAAQVTKDIKRLKEDVEALADNGCQFVSCQSQLLREVANSAKVGPNEIVALQNKLQFLDVMEKLWKRNPNYVEPVPKPEKPEARPLRGLPARLAVLRLGRHELRDPQEEAQKPILHDHKSWPDIKDKLQELAVWHQQLNALSSSKEIDDLSRQLKRVSHLSALLMKTKDRPMNDNAQACYNGIYALLVCNRPFLEPVEEHVEREIGRLCTLMTGLGISEVEKIQIISAMGLSQGHWYKCRNGHVYAIGECGGAMQEGKCPECNSIIGGGSHRLRGDNRLATEMDGATRSAWPGGRF